MKNNIVRNKLSKKITSLSLDKIELKRLLDILQLRANTVCEIECRKIETITNPENIEKAKEDLRSCAPLRISVTGDESEELFGTIDEFG